MQSQDPIEAQLEELASHLRLRRSAILAEWQSMARNDAQLSTASSLSRSQLYDHIPEILDAFESQIRARKSAETAQASADRHHSGAGHGLHRWQQGYQLREVMREWNHLHLCLFDEMARFEKSRPDIERDVILIARRALAVLCSDGVCESASQYTGLQQAEAASRVRDLQLALEQLSTLEKMRAEMLREAAHDLRGNVGVVRNASALLKHRGASEEMRHASASILETSIETLQAMLEDLMSLARLEAGHERKDSQVFNAGAAIRKLCGTLQPMAVDRSLFLEIDGPSQLMVEGDPIKTQRIVQNLVLNALKYTLEGGVIVNWGHAADQGSQRWFISVKDTGPGFQAKQVTPIARVLKQATDEAKSVERITGQGNRSSTDGASSNVLPAMSSSRPAQQTPGEGIGLLIVKRLCDLLDASLELETRIDHGTTFRVILPGLVSDKPEE